jgi:hypothetical protein
VEDEPRSGGRLAPGERPLTAALVLGCLNAAVAAAALALVELATADTFGWYAYGPLDEVVVRDPRFPWHYVVVPLVLLVVNVAVVRAFLARALRDQRR